MKVDIFNTHKKYNIIYADPPWAYKDKALAGNRGLAANILSWNQKIFAAYQSSRLQPMMQFFSCG